MVDGGGAVERKVVVEEETPSSDFLAQLLPLIPSGASAYFLSLQ